MVTFSEVVSEQSQQEQTYVDVAEINKREPNVGDYERIATGLIGGLLIASAIVKPTGRRLLLAALGGGLIYRGASGYCPGYEALGINRSRGKMAQPHDYYRSGIHVHAAYVVDRPANELYQFWRNFENLPRFMKHVDAVRKIDERRSHWVARGPAGMSLEWDAEIINEEPNHLVAWRSLENADVDNAGSVRFSPAAGGRGTEVRVEIEYIPPGGQLGKGIAWLFGEEPRMQIEEDLRGFKRLMETGELPSTEGQPKGSCR